MLITVVLHQRHFHHTLFLLREDLLHRDWRLFAADAQMLRVDDIRIADTDGPLDDVFQFSDVPRPVVRKHLLDRLARELFRFQPIIPADLQQKLVDEQIQVRLVLADRRHVDWENI